MEFLGGRCALCGAVDDLEFDHVKVGKKDNITRMLTHSQARLREELAKCQLLCVECHEEITLAREATLGEEAPF